MNAMMVLAAEGEAAKSGPWGFAIILLLCIACYFLFKSMSKHMKQVREHPPTEQPHPSAAARPAPTPAPASGEATETSSDQAG